MRLKSELSVTRNGGIRNRLLLALPPADFDLLAPQLETVALDQGMVIARAGDRAEHVFFPHSGAISLMIEMPDGEAVATALVGREGVIGSLSIMEPSPSAVTAVVCAAGTVSRISTSRFHAALNRSTAIRYALQLHLRAMLIQLQYGMACNALHAVKARMACWLLRLHDHVDDHVLPLTQETLSQIIGVQRTTVNALMRDLRESGAIRPDGRGQIVINRLRLKAEACQCHRTMQLEIEALFQSAVQSGILRSSDGGSPTQPLGRFLRD